MDPKQCAEGILSFFPQKCLLGDFWKGCSPKEVCFTNYLWSDETADNSKGFVQLRIQATSQGYEEFKRGVQTQIKTTTTVQDIGYFSRALNADWMTAVVYLSPYARRNAECLDT